MKKLLGLFALLLIQQVVNARTYWAWTEEEFRSYHLVSGDEMNFMGSKITFRNTMEWVGGVHYQSGNDHTVLSGFEKINNWQRHSSNIYYTTLNQDEVNVVTIDGKQQAMGRYPNEGYLLYDGHAGVGTIWGPYYVPTNFTGAEAVVKKKRYLLDRHIIKYQGWNYLEFDCTLPYYQGNNNQEGTPGNGFFIQGHYATLDKQGEWFFNKADRRLYMYFEGDPSQINVEVAVPKKLVNMVNQAHIKIEKLEFEGADTIINCGGSTDIKFDHCIFNNSGSGIIGAYTDNIQVWYSEFSNLLSWGLDIEEGGNNTTVKYCNFHDIGLIPGMGKSGDGVYSAIAIEGDNTYVQNNEIKRVGFNAITFHGSVVYVNYNLIDSFCLTKDDGGGIYTHADFGEVLHDRYVSYNIVLNAVGNSQGALGNGDPNGEAAGIYNDGGSNFVNYSNNFLANGSWVGILNAPNPSNTYINNVMYNFGAGIALNEYGDRGNGLVRHFKFKQNIIIAKQSDQHALLLNQFFAKDDFRNYTDNIGDWGYNLYSRPINQGNLIDVRDNSYKGIWQMLSLPDWKTFSGQDIGSQQPDVQTSSVDNFLMDYNWSDKPKTISLDGLYQGMWGETYYNSFTIAPYSGAVLLKVSQYQ